MRPLSNWDERAASPILTRMASPIPTRMALHSSMPAYKLRPCLTLPFIVRNGIRKKVIKAERG